MPPPSSAAERLAAHWVADTLAASEAIDFSVIQALVGVSPQYVSGAPDSVRERVMLRCLEELATFADADEGGAAVAPPPSKILRVDDVRSCEDLLIELSEQVGSSGILDKDTILPCRQDIQNFICIKKPTLPESSLELLREVDPKIQCMVTPSSVVQNGIKKHDSHQSLRDVHHLNSNSDSPRPPIASTELQPGNLTNLVNNLEKGDFKQCPVQSTVDLDKPLETDRRFYNQPRDYAINAASVSTMASEKDPSNDSISGFAAACLLSMSDKIRQCSQDHEANDSLRVSLDQVLCRKCGKDGQLVQCSSCLLSAHDSCFGSSVAFEDPGKLYCPKCIFAKATEKCKKAAKTYIEAKKSLESFLGAGQFFMPYGQLSKLLPRAIYSEGQLIGHNNSSKRKTSVSETTVDDLAHQGEESNRQRKKQKINVRSDACNDVVIEKASSVGNSDVAPMKDSMLQNKSNQLQGAEQDHVENTEAHEGSSSQNRCSLAANQEVESDKEDGSTHSHLQSEDSDGIEFTSPNYHRASLQEREAMVSSNSREVCGQKDRHMPLPSRMNRKYAYPPERCYDPETGRREKLFWTVKEEATLKEAIKKFTPRNGGSIPWVLILEYGRNVFHETRRPSDLRVKWRNMKKRGDA